MFRPQFLTDRCGTPPRSIHLFGVSENLEDRTLEAKEQNCVMEGRLAVCSLHLGSLESDRDATTNRPSVVTDESQNLAVLGTRLGV